MSEILKVGIVKNKKKAKHRKSAGKSGDKAKTPSGIPIHSGHYSAKDYNKLKPLEKAKVKQLHEEAKKHSGGGETDKGTKEGSKAPLTSNDGNQFAPAAHGEQKKAA